MSAELDEKFMREALREAGYAADEDEVPVGAVVVCRGRIIGRGHNMTRSHSTRGNDSHNCRHRGYGREIPQ